MNHAEVIDRVHEIANRLRKNYHAQNVILFGSRSRGEASIDSDTDLFIIAQTDERFFERTASVLRLVRDLYSGLALSPIVLTPEEVHQRLDRGDTFVKGILESGLKL